MRQVVEELLLHVLGNMEPGNAPKTWVVGGMSRVGFRV